MTPLFHPAFLFAARVGPSRPRPSPPGVNLYKKRDNQKTRTVVRREQKTKTTEHAPIAPDLPRRARTVHCHLSAALSVKALMSALWPVEAYLMEKEIIGKKREKKKRGEEEQKKNRKCTCCSPVPRYFRRKRWSRPVSPRLLLHSVEKSQPYIY